MGRILQRELPSGDMSFRCAECGETAVGSHKDLCWCGVEVGGFGSIFECVQNPDKSRLSPQEILVRETDLVKDRKKSTQKSMNQVRVRGLEFI